MIKELEKTKMRLNRQPKIKRLSFALLFCFLCFCSTFKAVANEDKKADIDATAIVLEHLSDSYEWHITNIGDKAISIPLPIILKSKDNGWNFFMSSKLHHGAEYKGFRISPKGRYEGKIVENNNLGEEIRPTIDISITKTTFALIINCIILLLIILPVSRWYKKHKYDPPKGFKGFVEMIIIDIQDGVCKPCIGEDYKRYTTYLLTVFFFVLVNNLMGIIPFFPGGSNVTGNIAITFFLALCTFLVVNITGNRAYWKEIFNPEVPSWLKFPLPIMTMLEIVSVFTKPFALMIRLFANILAGHSAILGLVCLIFITASMGATVNTGMSVLSVLFTIFLSFVELLVAYIQAYVFTLLSAVFIGLARMKHETSH